MLNSRQRINRETHYCWNNGEINQDGFGEFSFLFLSERGGGWKL